MVAIVTLEMGKICCWSDYPLELPSLSHFKNITFKTYQSIDSAIEARGIEEDAIPDAAVDGSGDAC